MTKLITYETQVELASTDTQILVTLMEDGLVDIHMEHDMEHEAALFDNETRYEVDGTFTKKEFAAFVSYLNDLFVHGLELSHEKIDLDAE
jgi:hypothetical protein